MKNTKWTIKVEHWHMTFYISHIEFEDIARAAAKGIQTEHPDAKVSVFLAREWKSDSGE